MTKIKQSKSNRMKTAFLIYICSAVLFCDSSRKSLFKIVREAWSNIHPPILFFCSPVCSHVRSQFPQDCSDAQTLASFVAVPQCIGSLHLPLCVLRQSTLLPSNYDVRVVPVPLLPIDQLHLREHETTGGGIRRLVDGWPGGEAGRENAAKQGGI